MNMLITYAVYLLLSGVITVFVGHTLHKRGRIFLLDCIRNHESAVDAVNDLLLVGFYLINFGYVALTLKYGSKPATLTESIEFLSTKLGLVLLILGVMHMFNIVIFTRISGRAGSLKFF